MQNRVSNGTFVRNDRATKGVPITVNVPTHLDVTIVETIFFYPGKDNSDEGQPRDLTYSIRENESIHFSKLEFPGARNLTLETKVIKTPKLMTVDFVKPGAGIGEFKLGFPDDADGVEGQYITSIEQFVFDRTLEDSANLLSTLFPEVGLQTPTSDPTSPPSSFLPTTSNEAGGDVTEKEVSVPENFDASYLIKKRVVAYRRFDLNDCDFEFQIQEFVNRHLNCCNDCSGQLPIQ